MHWPVATDVSTPDLIIEEQGLSNNATTRSQHNVSELSARIEANSRSRLDSYKRSFAARIRAVFGELPASVVETGLQQSWRAAMKPGQRFLASNLKSQNSKQENTLLRRFLVWRNQRPAESTR